jgi:hypothetical protein
MSMIQCEEAISFKLRKIVVEIGRHDIQITILSITTFNIKGLFATLGITTFSINVEGVTLVLPSRLFMFNKYWRILALS